MNFAGSSSGSRQYSIDPAASARMAAVAERQQAMGEEQWKLAKAIFEPYERQMVEANMGLINPNAELVKSQFESQKDLMPLRTQAEKGALQAAGRLYETVSRPVDINQRMGQAQADVEQAYAQGAGGMRRNLSRMGLAPGSERMTTAMRDMAFDKARAIGGARTTARLNAEREDLSRLGMALQARPQNLPYQQGMVQLGNYGLQNPMGRALGFYGNAIQANAAGMRPYSQSWGSSFGGGISTIKAKQDVNELVSEDFAKILSLRPVAFKYKESPAIQRMGFIAEEVENVIPSVVAKNSDGQPLGIFYIDLIPLLVGEIQRLNDKIATLESRVTAGDNGRAL